MTYNDNMSGLLRAAAGCSNTYDVPPPSFDVRSRINLARMRGSVRLMTGRFKTPCEQQDYINRVLNMKLP